MFVHRPPLNSSRLKENSSQDPPQRKRRSRKKRRVRASLRPTEKKTRKTKKWPNLKTGGRRRSTFTFNG